MTEEDNVIAVVDDCDVMPVVNDSTPVSRKRWN